MGRKKWSRPESESQTERERERDEEEEAWGKRRKTGGWCGESGGRERKGG
jgi:hypothetical protein